MATPYEIITDRVIAALEAGIIPWRKTWSTLGVANGLTGRAYRGINVFLLACQPFGSRFWLTFRQAKQLGGCVRKGEKGTPVVFWKVSTREVVDLETGEQKTERSFLLRYYTVFNLEQCDGVTLPKGRQECAERAHDPITSAEAIVAGMPKRPVIQHGGSEASYSPMLDVVRMPPLADFETAANYYTTLFHELTHATGHSSRCDRGLDQRRAAFGSDDYSREELVAEMGAAFLSAEAGIGELVFANTVGYIQGWLQSLKNDKKLVVFAAAQAQKAAEFILDRQQAVEEEAA